MKITLTWKVNKKRQTANGRGFCFAKCKVSVNCQ